MTGVCQHLTTSRQNIFTQKCKGQNQKPFNIKIYADICFPFSIIIVIVPREQSEIADSDRHILNVYGAIKFIKITIIFLIMWLG